ncbi:hypothetical protein N658DRAFT_287741 [Parathielavia hyrcaniae]|uniref:Uncharacterized protein n=1 Tax=Parathielavia hyrcaniae TaxID=113614 RepID=A0AAN6SYI2_9PEZI|nr:hypothetical protein N658DRAFT_287741 [Parathielavia hyrcaniae]
MLAAASAIDWWTNGSNNKADSSPAQVTTSDWRSNSVGSSAAGFCAGAVWCPMAGVRPRDPSSHSFASLVGRPGNTRDVSRPRPRWGRDCCSVESRQPVKNAIVSFAAQKKNESVRAVRSLR